MVIYTCDICDYKSTNKNNYERHNNTNKHTTKAIKVDDKHEHDDLVLKDTPKIRSKSSQNPPKLRPKCAKILKNVENICKYCNYKFARSDNLFRHLKKCKKKYETEKKLKEEIELLKNQKHNVELENEINILKTENEKYKNESEYFQAENNYHKRMLNEAGGLVKKSVSALTHIVHNYGSAPTIEMLNIEDIEDMEVNNKKLVEDIISSYKHKTLDKYLGNSIIKLYKKENPKDQSVWSTDTSRLTYLIKELMINNSSNWIIDKKGIKTKEYLIDPLLEHIKTIVISYQKNNIGLSTNLIEIEYALEINQRILRLVMDIDDGLIGNSLLKYISTHLFFNDKLLK